MSILDNPFSPAVIVRSNDPALAMTPADWKAYVDSGYSPALVKVHEGQKPDLFRVQRIPAATIATVLDRREGTNRAMGAFNAGITGICLANGEVIEPTAAEVEGKLYSVDIAKAEWFNRAADYVAIDDLYELGYAAIAVSRLPKAKCAPLFSRGG